MDDVPSELNLTPPHEIIIRRNSKGPERVGVSRHLHTPQRMLRLHERVGWLRITDVMYIFLCDNIFVCGEYLTKRNANPFLARIVPSPVSAVNEH